MEENKNKKITPLLTICYFYISILFTIPSINYLIKNRTVYYFTQVFTYTFTKSSNMAHYYINALIYLALFFTLFFLYFAILKNINKVFQNKKKMFIFIAIVGILFSIIIPTTSLDVYSYIGNGWVDSYYNENPYYTSVQDVTNEHGWDEMLGKVARCWREEPVVYGPVWSLLCRFFTSFSFGKITLALFIFKIASFLIFMGCNILIYKITKKKFFVALFGLNPFILFEFLSNVHNDIFLVFFILLAIYFIKNKQNTTLSVASIAIATGIKYLSVLLLPFLICYALRNEKLSYKIKKTIIYAIEFAILLAVFYLIYVRDLQVFSGIFVQQNKYGRSLFLMLWYLLQGDETILSIIKIFALGIFAITYFATIFKLFVNKPQNTSNIDYNKEKDTKKFNKKNITFGNTMKTYQIFLLIFTFILITNFNPWYVIWLFPTLMWQKAKMIRASLYLSLGAINSYAITYATKVDDETVGIPYLMVMAFTLAILFVANEIKRKSVTQKKME